MMEPHFVASVAFSGIISPQLYVQLKQAYEERTRGASMNLSTLQASSIAFADVSTSRLLGIVHADCPKELGFEYKHRKARRRPVVVPQ